MPQPPAKVVPRLRRLIEEGEQLSLAEVGAWVERARLAVAAAYGEESPNLERFEGIRYSLPIWSSSTPASAFDDAKTRGSREAVRMLRAFAEDLDERAAMDLPHPALGGKQVFLVHGRDEAVREGVARFLERLGLEPIILHERTDQGRTVIEKFEDHALEVGYAVILLTPDDFGRGPDDADWPEKANRPRQNVILEMGYFMGALGRNRTAALYVEGTELPSDIHGMLYIPLERDWEVRLAREMRDAGLRVDLNRL